MYQALYRSFRPETFEGLLGQEHIVRILKNQIRSGTEGHAYLFCGTRGTGKTTVARVLAKGVNCKESQEKRPCGICENCKAIRDGIFLDVIEIDAASNNGVDNIRELRESIKYPPVVGRRKVYIIDEVHMLSAGAFNALLKTLEEPPEYVMFILATTEPQKLPATILSRCLKLDFHRIPEKQIREGMRIICDKLGVNISDGALGIIAANGDGSVRDSLSILDQCIAGGGMEVTRQDVLNVLGTSGEEVFIQLTDMMDQGRTSDAFLLLDRILSDGIEVRQFMKDWISHYRNLMIVKFIRRPEDILNVSEENTERIREQSLRIDMSTINSSIIELANTLSEAKWSTKPRILLELCIVKLSSQGDLAGIFNAPTEGKSVEAAEKEPEEKISEEISKKEESPKKNDKKVQGMDVEQIWRKVTEEGKSQKGTFNMLRKCGRLIKTEEGCFVLELDNETALRYAKDNAVFISQLLEKHAGSKLEMECRLAVKDKEEKTAEEIAGELGNSLNINIEVK